MDSENKDLVPADWFQKSHDYTLFNYIVENIADLIDDMELKNTMLLLGAGTSDGGNYKGKVITTGYFNATQDVVCKGVMVVGKSVFDGLVIVDGNTKIAGKSEFKDYAIFGGTKTEIAGKIHSRSHIVSSSKIKLDGRISIEGNLYTDNNTYLKGEISLEDLRSTSLIFVNAHLLVDGDITAEEFVLSKGGGEVNNITAKLVSIGFRDKRTARKYHDKAVERVNLANPITLSKYIVGMVKHGLSFKRKKYGPFHIKGTIDADEIYLSNCIVDGDINGKNVTIGENVQIQGQITCSDKLELPAGKENEYNLSGNKSKITSG